MTVRRPIIAILILSLFVVADPARSDAEPVEVQIKALTQQVVDAIKGEKWKEVVDGIDKIEALGVQVPASLSYFKGRAYQSLNRTSEAASAFQAYISREGKSGKYYSQAQAGLNVSQNKTLGKSPAPSAISTNKDDNSSGPSHGFNWKEISLFSNALYHAEDTGNLKAQAYVGWAYLTGTGTLKDYEKAIFWLRKAAESGDSSAQANLGYAHENGFGVSKDDDEAALWYRMAAEQGDSFSKNRLKTMGK